LEVNGNVVAINQSFRCTVVAPFLIAFCGIHRHEQQEIRSKIGTVCDLVGEACSFRSESAEFGAKQFG
jgi:hypothetical protein